MKYHNILNLLFTFDGRINRRQFWVGNLIVSVAIMITGLVAYTFMPIEVSYGFVGVAAVFSLLAAVSLGIKRLHDRNRSGWWILLAYIPFFGMVWYVIEVGFFKSLHDNNRFGDAPYATLRETL